MSVGMTFENASRINPIRAGWVLGGLLGLLHLIWALLVAFGGAQAVLDFEFRMHFIGPAYVVQPFDPEIALVLVLVTSLTGFVIAAVFGILWNWVGSSQNEGAAE
jgi:uncharacterized oligopeptide transporter (OPT) family protein